MKPDQQPALDLTRYDGHTEGPWHWDSDVIKSDPLGRRRYRVTTIGKTITQLYYASDDEQAEPDAKLIADAPALLAELKRVRESLAAAEAVSGSEFLLKASREWQDLAETAERALAESRQTYERCREILYAAGMGKPANSDGNTLEMMVNQVKAECERLRADAGRLDELERLFKACPHAVMTWSDDPDEDAPAGYSITIDGCGTMRVSAPTLRQTIDLTNSEPDEDNNVIAAIDAAMKDQPK